MKLLIATHNAGKVRELREALREPGLELVGLDELGGGAPEAPDETGATFQENALLKARYYYEKTGLVTIADDSGLEVDVLAGRPGVRSARYGATDEERVERLLGELDGYPKSERGARFVCALALVGENLAEVFLGECRGVVRHLPVGSNGFGYDPVFAPDGELRSFAEMTSEEKSAVSHRGRAIRALVEFVHGRQ